MSDGNPHLSPGGIPHPIGWVGKAEQRLPSRHDMMFSDSPVAQSRFMRPPTLLLALLLVPLLQARGEDESDAWLEEEAGWEFGQNLDIGGEGLLSRDFQLTQWSARYGHDYDSTQWDASITYETYRIDLRSPDPFFTPFTNSDDRVLGQLALVQPLGERLTWQGRVGAYEGIQNYRSLWLQGYYSQLGALFEQFGNQPYPEVDPRGYQLATQLRYEYLPGSAWVEAGLNHFRDWIVPSADFEIDTLLGTDVIESQSWRLATENILTPRMRSLLEFQVVDTSVRELRYSLQGTLNLALAEKWVLRSQAAWVTEKPQFDAWFLGSNLEYDLGTSWQAGLSARYYRDTGEILESLPADNAPPGLESWQFGLYLRWTSGRGALKVGAGPYFTRYEMPDNIEAPFFEDLYRSRDWATFQLAWSASF